MYRFIWSIELKQPVTPESEQDFIDHWRRGSEVLQQYTGARGTHLHRTRDCLMGAFILMAEWDSQTHRDAMDADVERGESELAQQWNALPPNDSFGDITVMAGTEIGIVMPPQTEPVSINQTQ